MIFSPSNFTQAVQPIVITMRNRTGSTLQNGLQASSFGLNAVNSAVQGFFDVNQLFLNSANNLVQSWFG